MFESRCLDILTDKEKIAEFCSICKAEGIINNSSLEAMKMGVFPNDRWFAVIRNQQIVSLSGCHPLPESQNKQWRVLFRTATLPHYRAKAGAYSRNLNHEFSWSQLLPLQIEHGLQWGAESFFFTTNTNSSGDTHSNRVDHFVKKVLEPKGRVKFLKQELSYGVLQNFWKVQL